MHRTHRSRLVGGRRERGLEQALSQGLQEGEIRQSVAHGGHSVYLEDDPRLARYKIVGSGELGSAKQSEIAVEDVPPRQQ